MRILKDGLGRKHRERGDAGEHQGDAMKKDWQRKQLGELAELKGRIGWRGLTAKEYTKSGPLFLSVHSLNYGDYVDFRDAFHISEERYVESPEIILQRDDVLICKDGAGIGKVGIVGELPDRSTINSSLLLIRSGKGILPKFLYRCLSSPYFQQIVNSRLNGATTPHLYQRDITEFPVVLPPLPEQQRIVSILDEAFEGIATAKANAESNLKNARAIFESHLQSVFTHRGKGWVWTTLDDVWQQITDGKHGDCKGEVGSGFYFLSAKDVKAGTLNYENARQITRDDFEETHRRTNLEAGDILITNSGTIGRMAIAPTDDKTTRTTFQKSVAILKPVKATIDSKFAYYCLSSGLTRFVDLSAGAAQKNLLLRDLRSYRFALPRSLDQQRVVARKLDSLSEETQRLESIYQQKLVALEALKKSLLHQAFSGQL